MTDDGHTRGAGPGGPTVAAADGIRIAVEDRRLEDPRARIVIVHGYAEHHGRYAGVVVSLESAGLECHLFDLRGHGRSGGSPGHVDRYDDYVEDLGRVVSHVRALGGVARPLFLLAHSLGGLIAMSYVLKHPTAVDALALSSPYLQRAFSVPPGSTLVANVAARVAPTLTFDNRLRPEWLSHDRKIVAEFAEDPLVRRTTTARWFVEVAKAQSEVRSRAESIRIPILMMLGEDDPISDVRISRHVFSRLGAVDKSLKAYPGFLHEVLNEVDRAVVVADLTGWLLSHSG